MRDNDGGVANIGGIGPVGKDVGGWVTAQTPLRPETGWEIAACS
jgi:hypothetical protein